MESRGGVFRQIMLPTRTMQFEELVLPSLSLWAMPAPAIHSIVSHPNRTEVLQKSLCLSCAETTRQSLGILGCAETIQLLLPWARRGEASPGTELGSDLLPDYCPWGYSCPPILPQSHQCFPSVLFPLKFWLPRSQTLTIFVYVESDQLNHFTFRISK